MEVKVKPVKLLVDAPNCPLQLRVGGRRDGTGSHYVAIAEMRRSEVLLMVLDQMLLSQPLNGQLDITESGYEVVDFESVAIDHFSEAHRLVLIVVVHLRSDGLGRLSLLQLQISLFRLRQTPLALAIRPLLRLLRPVDRLVGYDALLDLTLALQCRQRVLLIASRDLTRPLLLTGGDSS